MSVSVDNFDMPGQAIDDFLDDRNNFSQAMSENTVTPGLYLRVWFNRNALGWMWETTREPHEVKNDVLGEHDIVVKFPVVETGQHFNLVVERGKFREAFRGAMEGRVN